MNPVKKIRKQK